MIVIEELRKSLGSYFFDWHDVSVLSYSCIGHEDR
jgi:hypothetical protein